MHTNCVGPGIMDYKNGVTSVQKKTATLEKWLHKS
jgi:hypothetical protein